MKKKYVTASLMENIPVDPRYKSKLVSKFVNCVMKDGKKSIAQRIVYNMMDILEERVKDEEPLQVFEKAINNVKPILEVRSKRVGGATYQVPMEVSRKRQQTLAFRWILNATRDKKGKDLAHRLADEITAAYHREGAAMTVRENVHKMAEANKAFAHFAW
jgi:small subunit ribosomal protein S7